MFLCRYKCSYEAHKSNHDGNHAYRDRSDPYSHLTQSRGARSGWVEPSYGRHRVFPTAKDLQRGTTVTTCKG